MIGDNNKRNNRVLSTPALLFDSSSIVMTNSNTGDGVAKSNPTEVVSEVIVHPMVLLHVLDHHSRRQERNGRVIGTLLGKKDGNKIEVTNCFAVPHAERGDEVAIGKDYNKQMLNLFGKCSGKETIVGWYATTTPTISPAGQEKDKNNKTAEDVAIAAEDYIADTSSLIHEFYSGETSDEAGCDPIHLVIDTRLSTNHISIRAYRNTPVVVQGEPLANLFHELKLTLVSNEPETICLHQMMHDQTYGSSSDGGKEQTTSEIALSAPMVAKGTSDMLPIISSMEKLHKMLDTTLSYVNKVIEDDDKIQSSQSSEVGRQITDTLASIPHIRPEIMDKLFHDSLQDLLMVTYLSNITRTQLVIAEKLNATLGV